MYSLRPFLDETSCIQNKELLSELLGSTRISKLWLSANHIFISTNDLRPDLHVFDVLPQPKWRGSSITTTKEQQDCILSTNQETTVEVVWIKSEPSLVYVVCESGTTIVWQFLRPSNEWTRRKCFQLNNAKGAKIVDVKLHEETGTIVWCERRGGSGEEVYCVCSRGINANNVKDDGWNAELGTIQAILHHCPPIEMFSFHDGVCIRPCQVHLEKFCIFWSGTKDMKAVVFKNASVEDSIACSSDFRDIATALIAYWGTNLDDDSHCILATAIHPSSDDIFILNYRGTMSKVQIKSHQVKLVTVCTIQLPESVVENTKNVKAFADGLTFGLIDQYGVIFLFDIVSGKLLQTMEKFRESKRCNVIHSHSAVPCTVFSTTKGPLEILKAPSPSEVVKMVSAVKSELMQEGRIDSDMKKSPKLVVNGEYYSNTSKDTVISDDVSKKDVIQSAVHLSPGIQKHEKLQEDFGLLDVVSWLSVYGLDHSAATLILDHVVAQMEDRTELPRSMVQFLQKLSSKVFQNPTTLLALRDNELSLEDESLVDLKQFLEEFDQGVVPSSYLTPLNIKIQPLLRELFNVMSRLRQVPTADLTKLKSILSDGTEAELGRTLESVLSGLPDVDLLDRMEIMCLHESERVVKELLPACGQSYDVEAQGGAGKVCQILRDELKDRRWKRRRNPDNALILGTFFKSLYKHHPELLLDVLKVAKTCISQGASKDEATIQDIEECIRDFMLEFLPSAWSEDCDSKRVEIHADLLVRLGLQQDAMDILIQRKQWQQALDLYTELSGAFADQQLAVQLYVTLLAGMLRQGAGTSNKPLLVKLLEMKPEVIQVHDLFQLYLRNVPKDDTVAILNGKGLNVQEVRMALGQFLPKT